VWSKDHAKPSIGTKNTLKREKNKDEIISLPLSVVWLYCFLCQRHKQIDPPQNKVDSFSWFL